MKKISYGFTLIELMITVAIVGILATVAYPSYNSYVISSNRSDAYTALYNMSALQERYYIQNNTYAPAAKIAQVGGSATKQGLYTISITAASSSAFSLKATPVAGKAQAKDAECTTLTLSSTGAKGSTGTRSSALDCW